VTIEALTDVLEQQGAEQYGSAMRLAGRETRA
jgi:hypothetical protein